MLVEAPDGAVHTVVGAPCAHREHLVQHQFAAPGHAIEGPGVDAEQRAGQVLVPEEEHHGPWPQPGIDDEVLEGQVPVGGPRFRVEEGGGASSANQPGEMRGIDPVAGHRIADENAVVGALPQRGDGILVERRARGGILDRGDIARLRVRGPHGAVHGTEAEGDREDAEQDRQERGSALTS